MSHVRLRLYSSCATSSLLLLHPNEAVVAFTLALMCEVEALTDLVHQPGWSKAVKWAPLEAASASSCGGGRGPSGWASLWECRAAQSRQARPEEPQEPGWGALTAKG